ncbi:hypothetical protein U1Q18_001633, partial [Sarracenia purpurea var. burkii]
VHQNVKSACLETKKKAETSIVSKKKKNKKIPMEKMGMKTKQRRLKSKRPNPENLQEHVVITTQSSISSSYIRNRNSIC